MKILEQIDDYLGESSASKEKIKSYMKKEAFGPKGFKKINKRIDKDFKSGKITAEEVEELKKEIDFHKQALKWVS